MIGKEHPQRRLLNDELHGRTGQPVFPPAEIIHLVFLLAEGQPDPNEWLANLCRSQSIELPAAGALQHTAALPACILRYERHGEFYRLTFIADNKRGGALPPDLMRAEWLQNPPGEHLVAIKTQVTASPHVNAEKALKHFGHDEVAASSIGQGQAVVWSDFRIGDDGFVHMRVDVKDMAPLRLGRALRRLHELETYRMMALLALPVARQLLPQLKRIEAELTTLASNMQAAASSEEDARLLGDLTQIARSVEELSSQTSYRFSAARAYAALVRKRITELSEERVPNQQRIGVFVDRRFSPAMATCEAVENRIARLTERCERSSNLLRTRVDISLERQNQELLASMNERAHQQLRLQETVEGLSVVAISYYAWSLLSKFADSLGKSLPFYDATKASLVLIPGVVACVWFLMKRSRRMLRTG